MLDLRKTSVTTGLIPQPKEIHMYQLMIKEIFGAGIWAIDIENVKNSVMSKIQITRAEIELALIFLAAKEDKVLDLLKRVLHESNRNKFSIEITELTSQSEPQIFKDITYVPLSYVPLVIVDFEGTIFSPVIYDADDQTWNYKGSELRSIIIQQWAYQSELYQTFSLPMLTDAQKQSIRQKIKEERNQEQEKKRVLAKNLMEDLKQGLSKAFPDASIHINEIKL